MTRFRAVVLTIVAVAAIASGLIATSDDAPSGALAFADPNEDGSSTTAPTTTVEAAKTVSQQSTLPTATPTTATTTAATGDHLAQANAHSLALLSQLRANVGVGAVTVDPQMSAFATAWSQEMAASGFRHSSGPYAENIVWYSNEALSPQAAAASFHDSWVNSSGHYANMTNSRWTQVGIGLYRDAGGWWGTHVFR